MSAGRMAPSIVIETSPVGRGVSPIVPLTPTSTVTLVPRPTMPSSSISPKISAGVCT